MSSRQDRDRTHNGGGWGGLDFRGPSAGREGINECGHAGHSADTRRRMLFLAWGRAWGRADDRRQCESWNAPIALQKGRTYERRCRRSAAAAVGFQEWRRAPEGGRRLGTALEADYVVRGAATPASSQNAKGGADRQQRLRLLGGFRMWRRRGHRGSRPPRGRSRSPATPPADVADARQSR